jgi:hypothetical protein
MSCVSPDAGLGWLPVKKTITSVPCVVGTLLAGLLAVSCSPPPGNAVGGPTGEVRLALTLPDGTTVASVDWRIASAANTTLASGTLNISESQRPSFIASLPPGMGDTVSMTATTSAGLNCSGTSPFDVVAGQTADVSVSLVCENIPSDGGVGSVVVSGAIVPGDHCPTLTTWLITPQAASSADPISVSVTASDADSGDTLSYAWSATSGTFVDPTSASTQYDCAATGPQTLTVQVSDNHMPVPCTTSISFPTVDCLP